MSSHPSTRQPYVDLLSQNANEEVLRLLRDSGSQDSLDAVASLLFRGVAMQQSGQTGAAVDAYREAVRLGMKDLQMCWGNLAGASYNIDHFGEALDVAEQLSEYKPFDIGLMAIQVLSLAALERRADAEKIARDYARRIPRNAELSRWVMHACWRNRSYLETILRSADIPPEAWDQVGIGHELLQCLIDLELFDVAEALFPIVYGAEYGVLDRDEIWATFALLELSRGRMSEALSIYNAGLNHGFTAEAVEVNLSLAELWLGDFEKGWQHYGARSGMPYWTQKFAFPDSIPRWQGQDVSGKTLVVASEQGIGDMIQFLRFVPALEHLGARIVFASYSEIVKLLKNDPRAQKTEISPLSVDDIDYFTLLLDVPCRLGVRSPADVPCEIPYLFANQQKSDEWREELRAYSGLRVGLVWAGNPEFSGDHYRSASINIFAPLAGISGVTFFALQKGVGAKEARCPPEGLPYVWLGDRFASFEDTAAAIVNLDLVISTDTSIVHLAAALGKPVWLLLSRRSYDYRWRDYGQGNPWYPNVRAFQQSVDDDWQGLIREQIRPALSSWVLASSGSELSSWREATLLFESGRATWESIDNDAWADGVCATDECAQAASWLSRMLGERDLGHVHERLLTAVLRVSPGVEKPALTELSARVALKAGGAEQAASVFSAIVGLHGDDALGRIAYVDWGWHLYAQADWERAQEVWSRGAAVYPRDGQLHYLLGLAIRDGGKPKDALPHFRRALECFPRHFMAHLAIATVLREDDPVAAWSSAQAAWRYKRNNTEVLEFVLRLLHDRGMYWLAEAITQSKLKENPSATLLTLRSRQLAMLGRKNDALRLLEEHPMSANAGVQERLEHASALYYVERRNEALAEFEVLVERYPDIREARFTLGFTQLRLGDCRNGWKNYWLSMRRDGPQRFPEWKGEDLSRKTLLVVQDQGQGDAIQFFPLLRELWSRGPRRMMVAVTPALVTLFRAQEVPFELIDMERLDWDDYRYDYQVAIMALPHLLDVDLMNPRYPQPTLRVTPGLPASWQQRLKEDVALKIGIVWSGGDLFKANYVRSTALEYWRRLWDIEGASFYSLQKDIHSNQAAVFDCPINNIAADCPTWLETLSAIDSLDLVITTCTAVAHVAGSINKPTWVLLSNEYVDFRWFEDREDSPWYPSIRLIRRQKGESWPQVLWRVADDLVERHEQLRWRQEE